MFNYQRNQLIGNLMESLKGMLAMHTQMKAWLEESGIGITEAQFDKLAKYLQLLKEKNEQVNLTRITDNKEAWIKHILDSLMAAPFLDKPGMMVADIGTGGGMPGIPLAILFPSCNFLLVDSTVKKINAIQEFADKLNLKNVRTIAMRLEALGQHEDFREEFDLVLARALAPLRVLLEYSVPLIHPYGNVIAYKGPEYLSELGLAKTAVEKLRCESPCVFHYSLPEGMGDRTLLQITKKNVTPDVYPRREGTPSKNPL